VWLLSQIGVSNYQIKHLQQIKPTINQIEISPFLPRIELKKYCQQYNIQIVAHSSLTQGKLLANPQLQKIATQFNIKAVDLLLYWALQQQFKIIPRSSQYQHIKENIESNLNGQIMPLLEKLDNGFAVHQQHIEKN